MTPGLQLRQLVVLSATLMLVAAQQPTAYGPGAVDCPCLAPGDPGFAVAQAQVLNTSSHTAGYTAGIAISTAGYGLGGCRTYDEAQSFCTAPGAPARVYPHWCVSQWCYVDRDRCSATRRPMESSVIPGGLHFSYNTCGQLDRYSVFSAFATGRTLRISTGISPPYVTAATTATDSDSAVPGWPYDGSLIAFADALCKNFDAPPAINVTGDFATAESMAALGPFSTPWSACVHDVAVGNYDLCAVDIWMTPERMRMTDFLPPFDTEQFRLMVLDEPDTDISFGEAVHRIFLPFAAATWAVVVTFLVGLLAFWWLVEWSGEDRPPGAASARAGIIIFLGLESFFTEDLARLGEPKQGGRLIKFALAFFLFMTRSLFTANLTAVLVSEATANRIDGMDDAIAANLVICTGGTTEDRLRQAYPGANFHIVAWEGLVARNLKTNGGVCDAAVMPNTYWHNMQAGAYAEMDCVDNTTACRRDGAGEPDLQRDCGYVRVGDLVTTVPVSMPVRSDVAHALGWSTLDLMAQGAFKALQTGRYAKDMPTSVCSARAASTLSLPPQFLKGCVGISGILVVVGLLVHLVWRKTAYGGGKRTAVGPAEETLVELGGGPAAGLDGGGGEAGEHKHEHEHDDVVAMLATIGEAHAMLTARFAAPAAGAPPPELAMARAEDQRLPTLKFRTNSTRREGAAPT